MKLKAKILTLVLVLATLISIIGVFAIPASAATTVTINGDLASNGWSGDSMSLTDGYFTKTITLTKGTWYTFKIVVDNTWYGNSGIIGDSTEFTSPDGWDFSTSGGNCTIYASVSGAYTFKFDSNSKKLIVICPEEAKTSITLKPSDDWKKDGARFAVYYFKEANSKKAEGWVSLSDANNDGYFDGIVPAGYTYIFCRMNGSDTNNDWGNKWNQTGNLSYTSGTNCYCNITDWNAGSFINTHTEGTAATCTTAQTCTVCGETIQAALGHNYTEKIEDTDHLKESTDCQTSNIYWYDCSRCTQNAKNDANATNKYFSGETKGSHNVDPEKWVKTDTQHYHACTVDGCDHTEDADSHSGGTATCTEQANCSVCSQPYGSVNASNHNYTGTVTYSWNGDYTVCTATQECSYDNSHTRTATSTKVEQTNYTAPTCNAVGSATYVPTFADTWCTGDKTKTVELAIDGDAHDFTGAVKSDENGITHSYLCKNGCGNYGDATECSGGEANCVTKATCSTCNQKYGSTNDNHNYDLTSWSSNGDGHWRVCSNGCGTKGSYAGHTPNIDAATETDAKVCTVCEYVIQQALGHTTHNYTFTQYDSTHHWKKCYGCDLTTDVEEHSYSENVTTPASCTTVGSKHLTCTCGYEKDVEIPALNHSYNTVVTNPTCTKQGYTTYTCIRGDHTYVDNYVDALDHIDENTDHKCDRNCGKTDIGAHTDSATDKDHVCDYGCSESIGTHADTNNDHACDYGCSVTIGDHADSATDDNHVCDYGCGAVLEDCADKANDGDHNCDVCGKDEVTGHSYANPTCTASSTCTDCGATSGAPMGHKFTTNVKCDNGCGTNAAAQVGENYYETFADAFEKAAEATESRIVLIQNVNLTAAITVSNNITIDLNGNSIALAARSGSDVINVEAGATLVFEGNGSVIGDINVADGGTLVVKGGTFSIDVTEYVADGYVAIKDLNGNWVVGKEPTATVNNLGSMIIPGYGYTVYGNGSNTDDLPLSFVMQFLADQDEEDMETSPYADWYADFVLTFTGIEEGSFTADGCYLAGYYGDFGWVVIPVDGMIINNGQNYPVMLGVNFGQKYDYICSGVKDFRCALYIPDEILEANPNLEVSLSLHLVDNSKGEDAAAEALVEGNAHQVVKEVYEEDYFRGPAAQIGVNEYNSLQDAVDAATDDDTIVIIRDNDSKYPVEINKNVTIDLGGYTFNGAIKVDGAEVTFNNGRVINTDTAISVENGGKLIIESGYYEGGIECADGSEVQLLGGIYDRDVTDLCSKGYKCNINENGYYSVVATPFIGANGNWYIGNIDTGVRAKGENGQSVTINSYDKKEVKENGIVVSHDYIIEFSNGKTVTINVPVARSIVNVEYDRSEGKKDIYVITYSDGSTSEFTVTNGTDGHSPVITIENGEWCIDGTPTGIKAVGKDGKGIASISKTSDKLIDTYTIIYTDGGEFKFTVTNGRGIVSIALQSTSDDGLVDTYIITYNDGSTSTFTVTNGANGIQGIQGEKGDDGHTPVITIQNGKWHIDGADTGMQAQGVKGETGNGISDISKTGIDGLVDTYTITYTDGTKTTFTVTNGAQGAQGIQGIQGVPGKDGHTPVITIGENGNWFVDGADTGVKAEAIKGETGAPGADGEDGDTPYIGENGNWFIDGVDTGVKAEGKDGNDNNKIIILCIGIAALCIITTIVAVATKKFRRPWWILC